MAVTSWLKERNKTKYHPTTTLSGELLYWKKVPQLGGTQPSWYRILTRFWPLIRNLVITIMKEGSWNFAKALSCCLTHLSKHSAMQHSQGMPKARLCGPGAS